MNSSEIRSTFLNYFKKNGHEIVHSSPLVPHNDPTLMFANSGMVQFKNIFTGKEKRDYSRSVVLNFNNHVESKLSNQQVKNFLDVAECIMIESKKFENFVIN